jgi:hypothetical protein
LGFARCPLIAKSAMNGWGILDPTHDDGTVMNGAPGGAIVNRFYFGGSALIRASLSAGEMGI